MAIPSPREGVVVVRSPVALDDQAIADEQIDAADAVEAHLAPGQDPGDQ